MSLRLFIVVNVLLSSESHSMMRMQCQLYLKMNRSLLLQWKFYSKMFLEQKRNIFLRLLECLVYYNNPRHSFSPRLCQRHYNILLCNIKRLSIHSSYYCKRNLHCQLRSLNLQHYGIFHALKPHFLRMSKKESLYGTK